MKKRTVMRKSVLDVYVDVTTEEETLHSLLVAPGGHVTFVGAGVSKEADVPMANEICTDIRQKLEALRPTQMDDSWADDNLNWSDASRRYGTCLERYGSAEDRVNYFRGILRGRRPSFAHHAIALLMAHDRLYRTALTTNFDKLLEQAFNEQNLRECQAIRMSKEAEFWGSEQDKCYVFKLHGDYDTHNILNTRSETRAIRPFFVDLSQAILRGRGLLVLGSAGNEQSIINFLYTILSSKQKRVLSRGIKWGVYAGPRRPVELSDSDEISVVTKALERGVLNRKLVELLSDMNGKYGDLRPCSFFPVWGSSNFLLRLIESTHETVLKDEAMLLLDHDMRLTALFRERGLTADAVDRHLERLKSSERSLAERAVALDPPARPVKQLAPEGSSTTIKIVYGDITSRRVMVEEVTPGRRRAVISPEDTNLSAGGGVALSLLQKAGARMILNELGKYSPIQHGTAVVTSAGQLPLHYIIHAAVLDVDRDGGYHVTADIVHSAVRDAFAKADALGITEILVPLLGAGVAGLSPADSLQAVLRAAFDLAASGVERVVTVVIYDERSLTHDEIHRIVDADAG
jgi:O-acetyl-ADP-ribose deacetylase (regulator of RNase III)